MMSHLSGGRILICRSVAPTDPSRQSRAERELTLTQIKSRQRDYETKVEGRAFRPIKAPDRQSSFDR